MKKFDKIGQRNLDIFQEISKISSKSPFSPEIWTFFQEISSKTQESNEQFEKNHSKHPANKHFKKAQIFSFTKLNVEKLPKNYNFSW